VSVDSVRVLQEFFVTRETDTPENRMSAEEFLRGCGATVFKHAQLYCIDSDKTMLQSRGYVVENA
jgi:hypothetical protein